MHYMPVWLAIPGNAERKAEADRKLYERQREERCARIRERGLIPDVAEQRKTYERTRSTRPGHRALRKAIGRRWRKRHPDAKKAETQARRARLAGVPGKHSEAEREAVREQYGHRCAHCGGEEPRHGDLTIDHIIPVSLGGTNWVWNLQPLCSRCNESKGDRMHPLDAGKLHG